MSVNRRHRQAPSYSSNAEGDSSSSPSSPTTPTNTTTQVGFSSGNADQHPDIAHYHVCTCGAAAANAVVAQGLPGTRAPYSLEAPRLPPIARVAAFDDDLKMFALNEKRRTMAARRSMFGYGGDTKDPYVEASPPPQYRPRPASHWSEATPPNSHTSSFPDQFRDVDVGNAAAAPGGEENDGPQLSADGGEYVTGWKLALIIIAISFGVLLLAFDNTMMATALPTITSEFNSLEDLGWYGSAYLLTGTSLNLAMGKFLTYFSVKWVYLTCIIIFEAGSLICALAPNSMALIIGRAVAGIGGAGLFTGGLVILAFTVPLEKRPIYAGVIGSMYGIASVSGPLLGGVFTQTVGWRWCFWMNLPMGGIVVLIVLFFFTDPKRDIQVVSVKERILSLDPAGTFVFMGAMVCLLLAFQWGGVRFAWRSPQVIGLLTAGFVLVAIFVALQQWGGEYATVPPRVMKQQTVWASSLFAFFMGAAFLLVVFYYPTWHQGVRGQNPIQSGLRIMPMLAADVLISVVSGVAISYFGYVKPVMMAAGMLMAVGYGLMSTFQVDSPTAMWVLFPMIAGAGVGAGLQQPMLAMQTVLPIADVPTGTAIVVFLQGFGSTISLSVGNTVVNNLLREGIERRIPSLDPETVVSTGPLVIMETLSDDLARILQEVYNNALTRTFFVAALLAAASFFSSCAVEWRNMKDKPESEDGTEKA